MMEAKGVGRRTQLLDDLGAKGGSGRSKKMETRA
jgi:hypothetical protein